MAQPHPDDHRSRGPRWRRAAGHRRQRIDEAVGRRLHRQTAARYSVATAGSVEESAKSQGPIAAVVPLMLFVMATILMIQLQSFQRLFLVVRWRRSA
ncbi:efflux RND transporter permease subunit [Mesorhizobium sp. L103C119B0]|uniref:efflux RND transporter permease subunit n=1 Tax=Mesorhizobium sp. L103C119B0 TaxID=1287085 RepID=UPI0012DD60F8|nr:efflux RND transporter permease subunit [Mesorhizobium sp. L103C119B0]